MVYISMICLLAANTLDISVAPAVFTALDGDVRIIRAQDSVETRARVLDHLFDGDSVITGDGQATVFFLTGRFTVIRRHEAMLLTLLDADTSSRTSADPGVIDAEMNTFRILFDRNNEEEISILKKIRSATHDTFELTIYAPGNTTVGTRRPDMLWSSFPGANWYSVMVADRGAVIKNIATTDTFFSYPRQHDSLSPGSYVLRVCAFHNNDSLCSEERLFQVLGSEDIDAIDTRIDKIVHTCPEASTADLLTALVYKKHGLKNEAIDAYKDFIQRHPVPFAFRALAVLYSTLGISEVARHYYDAYVSLTREP